MLVAPDSVASVSEDIIKPFGEQKHDGPIPILDKNYSNEEVSCRRLALKTGQMFAIKESFAEVEKRWAESLTATQP